MHRQHNWTSENQSQLKSQKSPCGKSTHARLHTHACTHAHGHTRTATLQWTSVKCPVSSLGRRIAPAAIHLSPLLLNMGHFLHDNMLYVWPLQACHMASKGDPNIVTAPDILLGASRPDKSFWQLTSGKSYPCRTGEMPPDTSCTQCRHSSQRKYPD